MVAPFAVRSFFSTSSALLGPPMALSRAGFRADLFATGIPGLLATAEFSFSARSAADDGFGALGAFVPGTLSMRLLRSLSAAISDIGILISDFDDAAAGRVAVATAVLAMTVFRIMAFSISFRLDHPVPVLTEARSKWRAGEPWSEMPLGQDASSPRRRSGRLIS